MKKYVGLLLIVLSAMVFVACGSAQSQLDGEYYYIDEYGAILEVVISGGEGVTYAEGTYQFKINEKLKIFTVEDAMNSTIKYEYSEGILKANLSGLEREYYKKGTKAFDNTMKENDLDEDDIDNRKD